MATVPFVFECSKESGFLPDPNENKRVGYIIELDCLGLGTPLLQDLQVSLPYNTPSFKGLKIEEPAERVGKIQEPAVSGGPKTTKIVGVIEKFEWTGGTGDALKFEFYVSQENAFAIKALQQQALETTVVKKLTWWISDYDQDTKRWFEQSFPLEEGYITGNVAGKENPDLGVDLSGVPVKDGIDVNVYKVTMGVVPGLFREYALHFAMASQKPMAKTWGQLVKRLDP
jgi:hypothetical protein